MVDSTGSGTAADQLRQAVRPTVESGQSEQLGRSGQSERPGYAEGLPGSLPTTASAAPTAAGVPAQIVGKVSGQVWRGGRLDPDGFDPARLKSLITDPGCLVWVDLCAPSRAELDWIGGQLGLDAHTLEDALSHHERPKASRFEGYSFATFATARRVLRRPEEVKADRLQRRKREAQSVHRSLSQGSKGSQEGKSDKSSQAGQDTAAKLQSLSQIVIETRQGRERREQQLRQELQVDYLRQESYKVVEVDRVSAYTLPTCLLTIRQDERFDMGTVIGRWADDQELVKFGVDGLLQGLLDVVIDQHFEILQEMDDAIEDLIDVMFDDNPDIKTLQRRTFSLRRELVGLRRVISPMRDIVATLIRAGQNSRAWSPTLLSYYEDLNDHTLRSADWLESLRDLISTIYDTNISLNDTRMNEVMKKLAAWAAIIAVPTLITGFYGMNVPYWGFNQPIGFGVALGLIVAIGLILFISFKRRDWL